MNFGISILQVEYKQLNKYQSKQQTLKVIRNIYTESLDVSDFVKIQLVISHMPENTQIRQISKVDRIFEILRAFVKLRIH